MLSKSGRCAGALINVGSVFVACCTGHSVFTLTVIGKRTGSIAVLMFAALLQQIPQGAPGTTNQQKLSERILRCTADLSFANETKTRSRHAWGFFFVCVCVGLMLRNLVVQAGQNNPSVWS